jgi:RNA polymerase sigma-70 factor, ECF subfamily
MAGVDDEMQDLVERAQGGDGGAFGELYERFAPEIRLYLLRQLCGQHEAAEDLTEEVFVKVLRRLGDYQMRGLPFSAWLYRIARNHLIDHLRATRHRATAPLDAVPDLPAPDAERDLAGALDRHELAQALARLSDEQRRVVSLRFLEGLTTAETAQFMSKTEDAVKKLQARGLTRMRKSIAAARLAGDRRRAPGEPQRGVTPVTPGTYLSPGSRAAAPAAHPGDARRLGRLEGAPYPPPRAARERRRTAEARRRLQAPPRGYRLA